MSNTNLLSKYNIVIYRGINIHELRKIYQNIVDTVSIRVYLLTLMHDKFMEIIKFAIDGWIDGWID